MNEKEKKWNLTMEKNKRKWKSHERFEKFENLGVKIVDEEGNLSKRWRIERGGW